MRIEDLNWMDVEKYLQHEDRLIFVLGSCEEHGYLSLLTDSRIPAALADAASKLSGVLVAPVLNYGITPGLIGYSGSITLRTSVFMDVVEDLTRSVYRQGFRGLLFLNGHGGNQPARSRLVELANEMPDLRMDWYSWWLSPCVSELAKKYNLIPQHASWMEAFPFTRVCDLPKGEKPEVKPAGILSADKAKEAYGDGVFGGHYQVSDEIMDELFQACLQDVTGLLNGLKKK
ncbi:MAG TPA: creatininase family protein [Longilinea sp.]|nr:creatininase family protein [Longilinea sp.]